MSQSEETLTSTHAHILCYPFQFLSPFLEMTQIIAPTDYVLYVPRANIFWLFYVISSEGSFSFCLYCTRVFLFM